MVMAAVGSGQVGSSSSTLQCRAETCKLDRQQLMPVGGLYAHGASTSLSAHQGAGRQLACRQLCKQLDGI